MKPKEKMLAALDLGSPSQIPVAPLFLGLYLDPFVKAFYRAAYRERLREGQVTPVDREADIGIRADAIIRAYGLLSEKPDWIHVAIGPSHSWAGDHSLVWEGNELYYVHAPSGERSPARGGLFEFYRDFGEGSSETHVEDVWDGLGRFRTMTDVESAVPVIPLDQLKADGYFDLPRRLVERLGGKYYLYVAANAPFWSTYRLLGFQGMMLAPYDNPEILQALMGRRIQRSMERLKGLRELGIPGVWYEEPFVSADLMSARMYDAQILPRTIEMAQQLKDLGYQIILYFCGDVVPRLPQVKLIAPDGLAVEESKKNFIINLEDIVAQVGGEMAVWGNVDAIEVVQKGPPDAIRAEVRRQVEIGRAAPGFIISTGSPLPLETPIDHLQAFIAAARQYGRRS